MKRIYINSLLCFFVFAFSFFQASAQNSIGLNIGLSSYEGDLHCFEDRELNFLNSSGISFGIHAKKELGKYFAGRLAYQFASFKGDDSDFSNESGHPGRNFSFNNNVHEFTLKLDLEPWKQKTISPFISIGAGIGFGNPDTEYSFNTNPISRQTLITKDRADLKRTFFALPLAAGVNFRVSKLVTIGAEAGLRLSSGDFLDGVSASGSEEYNDYFGTAAVTLNYTLGSMKPVRNSNRNIMTETSPVAIEQKQGADPGDISPPVKELEAIPEKEEPVKEVVIERESKDEEIIAVPEEKEVIVKEEVVLVSDLDGDGYADRVDNCPRVYSLTNNGCPENVVNSDIDCGATFGMNSVNFETSFADLSIKDKETLNSIIAIMVACPTTKIRLEGHTDSRGNDFVNQELSESRAKSVKSYLMRSGISSTRIRTVGYGENQPISTNNTEEGRSLNRRVEISFF